MKRTAFVRMIALLIALLCVFGLCSCSSLIIWHGKNAPRDTDAFGTSDTAPSTSDISHNPVIDIPEYKKASDAYFARLTGEIGLDRSVVIASSDKTVFLDTDSASSASGWRSTRNAMIEEKLGKDIIFSQYDSTALYVSVRGAVLSGLFYADLVAIPYSDIGLYYASGLLYNLDLLPFCDFDAPYYDRTTMDRLSIGERHQVALSDFCRDPGLSYAVYYNKALAEEILEEDPGALTASGAWTFDAFRAACAKASEKGIAGYAVDDASDRELFNTLAYISSGLYTQQTNDGTSLTPPPSDVVQKLADTIYGLLYEDKSILPNTKSTDDAAFRAFCSGKSLFYIGTLRRLSDIDSDAFRFGLLPMPTATSASAYHATTSPTAPVLIVPAHGADTNVSGLCLEMFSSASYRYIQEDFYDYYVNYVLQDNNSLNTLHMLVYEPVYDFALAYSSGYKNYASVTVQALHLAVTTADSAEQIYIKYGEQGAEEFRQLKS